MKLSQKALHNSTELVAFAKSYLGCIQDRYRTLITSKPNLMPSFFKPTLRNPKFEPFQPCHAVFGDLISRKAEINITPHLVGKE